MTNLDQAVQRARVICSDLEQAGCSCDILNGYICQVHEISKETANEVARALEQAALEARIDELETLNDGEQFMLDRLVILRARLAKLMEGK